MADLVKKRAAFKAALKAAKKAFCKICARKGAQNKLYIYEQILFINIYKGKGYKENVRIPCKKSIAFRDFMPS